MGALVRLRNTGFDPADRGASESGRDRSGGRPASGEPALTRHWSPLERHRHEAELARRRFMQVDSDNRLVAATLEADWNEKRRALEASRDEDERRRQEDRLVIDESAKARIHSLANDFPRLWRDPKTADRDRKRMVRLIIEDVTLRKEQDDIAIDVRFKGGATRSLRVPRPLAACEERRHDQQVVSLIAGLLEVNADGEIANILNERHLRWAWRGPRSAKTGA